MALARAAGPLYRRAKFAAAQGLFFTQKPSMTSPFLAKSASYHSIELSTLGDLVAFQLGSIPDMVTSDSKADDPDTLLQSNIILPRLTKTLVRILIFLLQFQPLSCKLTCRSSGPYTGRQRIDRESVRSRRSLPVQKVEAVMERPLTVICEIWYKAFRS
ncbi:hypothetical protein SAMN05444162_2592 [Paenibacillaceae bacterium GAS479]|nr:hypothetical protein SAMN05444162_2592 [Paenibacillaceae bacterium GAS479]